MKKKTKKKKNDAMSELEKGSKNIVKTSLIIGAGLIGVAGVKAMTDTLSS